MTPSHMDYPQNENATLNVNQSASSAVYTHKKFNTGCYKHKKFGKRSNAEVLATPTSPPLFRPYALDDNTERKRRQEQQQQQHQLPPTPPTTPPQQQQLYNQRPALQQQPQCFVPTATPTPLINHQAYAFMLQKQRTVLQIRQMLSINPDANTWPTELRNTLYSMLQR